MPLPPKRWLFLALALFLVLVSWYNFDQWRSYVKSPQSFWDHQPGFTPRPASETSNKPFRWENVRQSHPVSSMHALPSEAPLPIPKIQHAFSEVESSAARHTREERLEAVRASFAHTWAGYKAHAWLKAEVKPLSGGYRSTFGGWAATLVDSLDTLWIMGLHDEFDAAVAAVEVGVEFGASSTEEVLNVFETTIRYLGGFLAAYDLSGRPVLLQKAREVGEMLYVAFDTPNRMPICRWKWKEPIEGRPQAANPDTVSAELGSFLVEFTRLSQLTGDNKFFDAVQRITEQLAPQQNQTKLPGLWPVVVNAQELDFKSGNGFTIGSRADSLYEYLPKEYLLLGGHRPEYREMYENAIETAKANLFFRPMNPMNLDILVSGILQIEDGMVKLNPLGEHLVCFAGGMVAMAAKIFERSDDLAVARRLADGCAWAYASTLSGIMPETFVSIACTSEPCEWDEQRWRNEVLERAGPDFGGSADDMVIEKRLPAGFVDVPDTSYKLRPEAIESIFYLYRITGDASLLDTAWDMFEAINLHTHTEIAHAALNDVTLEEPTQADKMESFWIAETLKYFFLIFSPPDVISLDEYVFNTEAHPFKRPT